MQPVWDAIGGLLGRLISGDNPLSAALALACVALFWLWKREAGQTKELREALKLATQVAVAEKDRMITYLEKQVPQTDRLTSLLQELLKK